MKRDPALHRKERPSTIQRGETLHHTEMKRDTAPYREERPCTIQR